MGISYCQSEGYETLRNAKGIDHVAFFLLHQRYWPIQQLSSLTGGREESQSHGDSTFIERADNGVPVASGV